MQSLRSLLSSMNSRAPPSCCCQCLWDQAPLPHRGLSWRGTGLTSVSADFGSFSITYEDRGRGAESRDNTRRVLYGRNGARDRSVRFQVRGGFWGDNGWTSLESKQE